MSSLIFLIFGVGLVAIMLFAWYLSERRIKAFQAYAAANNLTYYSSSGLPAGCATLGISPGGWSYSLPGPFSMMEHRSPFNQGHSQRVSHTFEGQADQLMFMCCEYQYVTGSGKSRATHTFSVAIVLVPMNFPYFIVQREDIWGIFKNSIGIHDLQFESVEFNDTFHVATEDERITYDTLDPQMLQFLLAHPRCDIQVEGPAILFCESGSLETDFISYVRWFLPKFWEQVPEHVKVDQGIH